MIANRQRGTLISGSDYKQMGIGALHGTWNFGQQLTSIPLYACFGAQSAFVSINYLSGYSSFKNDWNSFKTSHTAWHAAGARLMHRVIPGNFPPSAWILKPILSTTAEGITSHRMEAG